MKIAVLGTGMVGQAIASALVALGHDVRMGSRTNDNERALAWRAGAGARASIGTYADAAEFCEIAFLCVAGFAALEAVAATGRGNLERKVLIDVTNPLDFSKGMPPTLFVAGDDSLAERIQTALPDTRVVKTLNTVTCHVMVDPARLQADHDVFMSGNDAQAKGRVAEILRGWFGWKRVVDLGDITTARGTEAYLLLWLRLWASLGTADFNIHVAR